MKVQGFKFNRGSWNLWRIKRLAVGLVSLGAGVYRKDWVLAAAGVFLMVHVYINACAACETGDCELPNKK